GVAAACLAIVGCAIVGCAGHKPATAGRSETAERLSEEARQARDRGDAQSAEYLLTAAVDHNPGDGETRLALAEPPPAPGKGARMVWARRLPRIATSSSIGPPTIRGARWGWLRPCIFSRT